MQPRSSTAKYYGAAAQYNKTPGGSGRIIRIIGLVFGGIILLSLAFIAVSALTSAGRNDAAQLTAREKQLVVFMTINQKTITNDNFQTANSNAISLASSDGYALQKGINVAYDVTAIPDAIAKAEVDTTSAGLLKTALVQSRFDAAYLQILRDKIASTESLARTVLSGSGGTLHAAVQTTLSNLAVIDNQLAKLQL